MDAKDLGCDYVDWIHIAQAGDQSGVALVRTLMNLRVPS
jgi:hypothetical protein